LVEIASQRSNLMAMLSRSTKIGCFYLNLEYHYKLRSNDKLADIIERES
jgi:hypothetical protein